MKVLELFDRDLFEVSGTTLTVATLTSFVVMVLVTFGLAALVRRAVGRAFAGDGRSDQGTAAVASRLARYAVLLVGLSVSIHHLGIDLTALFAAGAVFAVAIGFAMQNIAQNFVSGVILMLERTIKPGDVLEVEDRLVRVSDMGIRATVARTLDDEDIIIPNSILVSQAVKNYTLGDRRYRLRALVGVTYSADLKLTRRVLQATADAVAWRSQEVEPRVQLKEFGDSAVVFEVSVWIEGPWDMQRHRDDLLEGIWWALKEAEVTIAFPQMDLHLDGPALEALRGRGREPSQTSDSTGPGRGVSHGT